MTNMTTDVYLHKLKVEILELECKVWKLKDYLDNKEKGYGELSTIRATLLREQLGHMVSYLFILRERYKYDASIFECLESGGE